MGSWGFRNRNPDEEWLLVGVFVVLKGPGDLQQRRLTFWPSVAAMTDGPLHLLPAFSAQPNTVRNGLARRTRTRTSSKQHCPVAKTFDT